MVSPHVTSTSVECREFPALAADHDVYSVPKIVINDEASFVGGLPEGDFIGSVLEALGADK